MVSTTTTYPHDLQAIMDAMPYMTPADCALIERAFRKAEKAHEGQTRKSGEPYFTHCVAVAGILVDMKLDAESIAAALLHDVVEDTNVTLDELRREFGGTVSRLVDGVTKLAKLPIKPIGQESDSNRHTSAVQREVEYFRKMLMMMDDDIRVVLVKLADRLHNMRTLGYMSPQRQKEIARETMDIFAPLANRLGIWQMKWELEDLSFRYMQPDAYRAIATKLEERRADREKYMEQIADRLRQELERNGIYNTIITARPKHIYSIYRKMVHKDRPLEQIYDVRAVRVIVEDEIQCYPVLGIVHRLWHPIPGEFDDYIASPKDNFYRSLHTAVYDDNGKTVEVQIRTRDMHEDAEYGFAAHWRYKEGRRANDDGYERRIAHLRRLMEFGMAREEDPQTFMDRMKAEVFQDRIYVFTPKGDIIDLPSGATVLDFAYHIHTEIGHRCRGVKVNGMNRPLDFVVKTGDQVEIVTAKRGGPSMDWLNEALGYVKTSRARSKIRHWFRQQNRDMHITWGRDVLERELKRLGLINRISYDAVSRLFEFEKLDDFLAAIGAGDINAAQITNRVLEDERRREEERRDFEAELLKPKSQSSITLDASGGVTVMGVGRMLVSLSKCCNPMPGDDIVGFITRGQGVKVHRTDCSNIRNTSEPERLTEVSWVTAPALDRYAVKIEIVAHDRAGLLRDISILIADERVNISALEVNTRSYIATLNMTMEIATNEQLTRILSRIECISGVVEAHRRNA
jgi:GTP pyrophosphokinase